MGINKDIAAYATITGSMPLAEVLFEAVTTAKNGIIKPSSPRGLHALIKQGYLKPDFGHGVVLVMHDKIDRDLQAVRQKH